MYRIRMKIWPKSITIKIGMKPGGYIVLGLKLGLKLECTALG